MKHLQGETRLETSDKINGTTVNGHPSGMKANIGVYTNPGHDLWTAPAEPNVKTVLDGSTLKPGEVTIGIKNTGICG